MSKVADERASLTANLLNTAATGVFVTGVVAPMIAAFYGVPGPSDVGPPLARSCEQPLYPDRPCPTCVR